MLDFYEIATAIAHKLVDGMTREELEDHVHEHYTDYYAKDADEDEVVAMARQLGIEVESYLIKE